MFYAKAAERLLDTVSNWKGDWLVKGYEKGKPSGITTEVWDGLIRYWSDPKNMKVSESCSTSRLTKDEHGNGPMLHSTGQTPHAGKRLQMVIKYLIKLFLYVYIF